VVVATFVERAMGVPAVVASHEDRERGVEGSASEEEEEEWPFWKLALIALPQLGVMVLWIFLGPNTTPYAKSLGASESFATLNNSAGPIVGFIVGPLVGTWSDQSTSKWGRRRPIILAGLLSTTIAGLLYAGAKQLLGEGDGAMYLAAVMQWVLDFTINAMQTPFRALVSDLASPKQQLPMQIFFAVVCAVGCFIAFSIMKLYEVAIHHMLELMCLVLVINFVCVGIALSVTKEKQYVRTGEQQASACGPIAGMCGAFKGMPKAFYILLFVQCMVWLGNTVWGSYGKVWFTNSVYPGDSEAVPGSFARETYIEGADAFSTAGQLGSIFNLFLSFVFMGLGFTSVPNNLIYAPCLFGGALVCFMCAFEVGHRHHLAIACFVLSNVGLTAAGSIPYGIVAVWNKAAEEAGHAGSVAMQMAILNCCITVGQQLCTMILGGLESSYSVNDALKGLYTISMVANGLGGIGALFLTTGPGKHAGKSVSTVDTSESEGSSETD